MKSNERDMAIRPAQPATSLAALAGPRGVGTAVAFDWALAAEMIFLAARFALGIGSASMPMMLSSSQRTGATAAVLLAAVPCALAGEGMRRGVRLLRPFQIAGNALLTVYGIVQLPGAIGDVRAGHLSAIARTLALLVASPLIVWLLSRPQTRDWFAQATSAQSRARHGGRWIAAILIWAVIGGAAIAFDGLY